MAAGFRPRVLRFLVLRPSVVLNDKRLGSTDWQLATLELPTRNTSLGGISHLMSHVPARTQLAMMSRFALPIHGLRDMPSTLLVRKFVCCWYLSGSNGPMYKQAVEQQLKY